jgi:4-diphosphocytidyl-2-C-methyl-D-erythritol kinase
VSEPAPAKLNLFLRVLARRSDGYHDIETVVLPLTLADGIRASHRERGIVFSVAGPGAERTPGDEGNLVLRAARALAEATGEGRGATILLAKRIPVAAGLGGGSADAAATLRALDRLWGWGLGQERLGEIGAETGSDVPALIPGVPMRARGRGERVDRVEVARTWWVLMLQPFGVSSTDAYRWWDEDGSHSGPDPGPVVDAARAGDVDALSSLLFNDLERPVASRHPEVVEATRALLEGGAVGSILCGSGPTVAGLCRDGRHAEEVAGVTGGVAVGTITRPAV